MRWGSDCEFIRIATSFPQGRTHLQNARFISNRRPLSYDLRVSSAAQLHILIESSNDLPMILQLQRFWFSRKHSCYRMRYQRYFSGEAARGRR